MAPPLGATCFSWLLLPSLIASFSPIHSSIIVGVPNAPCRNEPKSSTFPLASPREWRLSASTNEITQTTATNTASTTLPKETKWEMPWSDVQRTALQDNLPKYTVRIPAASSAAAPSKPYALWRTMCRDVPELAGYPVPFLMAMHPRSHRIADAESALETPGLLPMVDDYEFASNGGILGRAYGLPGIADGTRINTPALVGVEKTLPLGYVTAASTEDDGDGRQVVVAYELGTCVSSSSVYSLDGSERSAALLSARRWMRTDGTGEGYDGLSSTERLVRAAKDAAVAGSGTLTDAEANRDLAYLGGATAMLLASAAAVGMLSHHLTVNVFWV